MTRHNIKNETISKAQCLACEGHVWYQSYLGGFWCQAPLECAKDEFMYQQWGGNWGYYCAKCTNNRTNGVMMEWVTNSSIPNFLQSMKDKCNACPERDKNGVWSKRWAKGGTCMPTCEQPENAEEQIEICKTNPKDERCTRKWQNTDATCFSCSQITNASKVDNDATLKTLCENCGRRVNAQGYCVPKSGSACEPGKFLGVDGSCHECSQNSYVQIESEEISGCTNNCKQAADGSYSIDGERETRFSRQLDKNEAYYANGAGLYCFPSCGEHEINIAIYYGSGKCQSCNDANTTTALCPMWPADCSKCPSLDVYTAHGTFCSPVCPAGHYKNRLGTCVSCSRGNSGDDDHQGGTHGSVEGQELCNACGNRILVKNAYNYVMCRVANPGVSGICNSVENNYYNNANLTSDIKAKAEPYINGSKDGIYYRVDDGSCRSCDSEASYTSTQAQCASCKNRRWENNTCLKGLCAEGKQFLNTSATCVACSQKNVPVNPDITNLCSSCENRRVMTTGFEEQGNLAGKCVEDCPSGMWQDKDGKCYFCEEASTKEIGTDEVSKNMCQTVCGRTIEVIENTDSEIIGYKCLPQ